MGDNVRVVIPYVSTDWLTPCSFVLTEHGQELTVSNILQIIKSETNLELVYSALGVAADRQWRAVIPAVKTRRQAWNPADRALGLMWFRATACMFDVDDSISQVQFDKDMHEVRNAIFVSTQADNDMFAYQALLAATHYHRASVKDDFMRLVCGRLLPTERVYRDFFAAYADILTDEDFQVIRDAWAEDSTMSAFVEQSINRRYESRNRVVSLMKLADTGFVEDASVSAAKNADLIKNSHGGKHDIIYLIVLSACVAAFTAAILLILFRNPRVTRSNRCLNKHESSHTDDASR